jgi:hypothetical protein
MKTNRYLPMNVAGVVLVFMLWQAQVKAQTAKEESPRSEAKTPADRDKKILGGVTKGQQRRTRRRGMMRQRALLYEPMIAAAARKYRVDPRALWTIAYLETRFRPNLVSPKGARGLMQFIPSTAARFNLTNPTDAAQSIDAAARYLLELTQQFNGRLDLVLASYNSGETAVECFRTGRTVRTRDGKLINPRGRVTGGVPPYAETIKYVRRGVFVFSSITSAAVFSPELIALTRVLQSPAMAIGAGEQLAIANELTGLRGSEMGLLYSAKLGNSAVAANSPAIAKAAPVREDGFVSVFFDVHSGARYLVKSGQIVKPLETVSDEASPVDGGHKETKSVYFASRED